MLNSLFQGYLKLKAMYLILKVLLKFFPTKNIFILNYLKLIEFSVVTGIVLFAILQ